MPLVMEELCLRGKVGVRAIFRCEKPVEHCEQREGGDAAEKHGAEAGREEGGDHDADQKHGAKQSGPGRPEHFEITLGEDMTAAEGEVGHEGHVDVGVPGQLRGHAGFGG